MQTFAERLAHAMTERKISGYQLARATGLTAGHISNLRSGKRGGEVAAETVARLARALRVSSRWLLNGVGAMDQEEAPRLRHRQEWGTIRSLVEDQHPEIDKRALDVAGELLDDPETLPAHLDVPLVRDLAVAVGAWRTRSAKKLTN